MVRIDHFVHWDDDTRTQLNRMERKLGDIMATEAQLLAALAEADAATTNIAEDIARILAREPISTEGLAAATALVERLRAVASVIPEDAPPA